MPITLRAHDTPSWISRAKSERSGLWPVRLRLGWLQSASRIGLILRQQRLQGCGFARPTSFEVDFTFAGKCILLTASGVSDACRTEARKDSLLCVTARGACPCSLPDRRVPCRLVRRCGNRCDGGPALESSRISSLIMRGRRAAGRTSESDHAFVWIALMNLNGQITFSDALLEGDAFDIQIFCGFNERRYAVN